MMVPWRIVPVEIQRMSVAPVSSHGVVVNTGWRPTQSPGDKEDRPFFSSIVTVSLAHFIKNLGEPNVSSSSCSQPSQCETTIDCNVLTERASC